MRRVLRWWVLIGLLLTWLLLGWLLLGGLVGDGFIYINFSSIPVAIWSGGGLLLLAALPLIVRPKRTADPAHLLKQISDAVQVYDKQQRVVWANEHGRSLFAALRVEDVAKCLANTQSTGRVTMQMLAAGEGQRVSVSAIPLADQRIVLLAKPLQGGQSDFYQSFIHRIVHDMRNPLAGIIAHASNLAFIPGIPEDASQSAETIEQEARRLARLVDSLLFDARLAHMPLSPTQVDLADLVEDALFAHDEGARQKDLSLELEAPGGSMSLRGEYDLLVRAFSNIIDNAIKYSTEGGHVWIKIAAEDTDYVVTVTDDGEGIPAQYLPDRIFQPLVRARRQGSGSGLGLSIVKKIIDMHYGEVAAERSTSGGTVITVRLPKETAL